MSWVLPLVLATAPAWALEERDPYDLAHAQSSAHFVVRWGPLADPDAAAVDGLLDALETSHSVYAGDLALPPPAGMDQWRFNVYLAGSSSALPNLSGRAALQLDAEGLPLILLDGAVLDDPAASQEVAAHELFHAVQMATGAFSGDLAHRWWFEASATFMSLWVFPLLEAPLDWTERFSLRPHVSVRAMMGDGAELDLYRAYGAWVLAAYADTGQVGVPNGGTTGAAGLAAWQTGLPQDDPLDRLAEAAPEGFLLGFWLAHTQATHWPEGAWTQRLDLAAQDWGVDHRVSVDVDPAGTEGLVASPADRPLGAGGAHIWCLREVDMAPMQVTLQGDVAGDQGSPVTWRVGTLGGASLETAAHAQALELSLGHVVEDHVDVVVVADAPAGPEGEAFGYQLGITEGSPFPDEGDPAGCGGCAAGPDPRTGLGFIALLLLGLGRRYPRDP